MNEMRILVIIMAIIQLIALVLCWFRFTGTPPSTIEQIIIWLFAVVLGPLLFMGFGKHKFF